MGEEAVYPRLLLALLDTIVEELRQWDHLCAVVVPEKRELRLILRPIVRAGAIYKESPVRQHFPCLGEDLPLCAGAVVHQLKAPAGDGVRLLAKHPLAGAGGVHQDQIRLQPRRSQRLGIG